MAEQYPNWTKLVDADIRKFIEDANEKYVSMIPSLYNMNTTSAGYERDMTYEGLGNFTLLNGSADEDSMAQGYETTYEFPEFAKSIYVQRKLYEDAKDKSIFNMAREFGLSYNRTREGHAAELFNNAFTATGTFSGGGSTAHADAKALCAADHPSKAEASYSGSNLATTALNSDNVETDRQNMRLITDGKGNYVKAKMDMLLVPISLEEEAFEIINSTGKLDTSDNNVNFHKGKYKLVSWDELTDSNNWFAVDSERMKIYLNWFDRVKLDYDNDYTPKTATYEFVGYGRWGFGASSWRWLIGHNVTS